MLWLVLVFQFVSRLKHSCLNQNAFPPHEIRTIDITCRVVANHVVLVNFYSKLVSLSVQNLFCILETKLTWLSVLNYFQRVPVSMPYE